MTELSRILSWNRFISFSVVLSQSYSITFISDDTAIPRLLTPSTHPSTGVFKSPDRRSQKISEGVAVAVRGGSANPDVWITGGGAFVAGHPRQTTPNRQTNKQTHRCRMPPWEYLASQLLTYVYFYWKRPWLALGKMYLFCNTYERCIGYCTIFRGILKFQIGFLPLKKS